VDWRQTGSCSIKWSSWSRSADVSSARHSPPESSGLVERARGRLGANEVFAGTRTPVAAVRAYLERGFSAADVLKEHPDLAPADVETARRQSV
jgi:uncharacterized protein (DUF433 family)